MNELKVFESSEFGKVRTMVIDEKPYFAGSDVARILGYAIPSKAVTDHCKGFLKQKGVSLTTNQYGATTEQITEMYFIPESDVYRLVMRSKLPNAERFQDWVVEEVLPSIRKHGAYMTPAIAEQVLNNPDFMIELLQNLKAERAKVAEMKPKALFYDTVADAKNAIFMREAAKVIGISGLGQNKLFQFLKDKKLLMDNNQPYQEYVNRGYFRTIEQNYMKPNGSVTVHIKTLVTQRGLDYIIKLIEGENKQITCTY